jgi:hypothetical protein
MLVNLKMIGFNKSRKWLTLLVGMFVISIIPFYLGYFFSWFNMNQCYSSALSNISSVYSKISSPNNPNWKDKFEIFLEGIPDHGYETECSEVQEYTASFLNRLDATIGSNPALKRDCAKACRPVRHYD